MYSHGCSKSLFSVPSPPARPLTLDLHARSYVPIKVDYSDLYDTMTFFRGGPDGKHGHDELAKMIGLAGKAWARDHVRAALLLLLSTRWSLTILTRDTQWRKQDMAAYMCTFCLPPSFA